MTTTTPDRTRSSPGGRSAARSRALALSAVVLAGTAGVVEVARAVARRAEVTTEWPTLALAVLLCAAVPQVAGLRWGRTGERWRSVTVSLVAVAVVVLVFRLLGGGMPWSGWQIWVVVPVAEELLFRGFCLGLLLRVLGHAFPVGVAQAVAVLATAALFGLEHLGSAAAVGPAVATVQVTAALLFGVLAGWLRVRTDAVVAPVLAHAVMNAVAVT